MESAFELKTSEFNRSVDDHVTVHVKFMIQSENKSTASQKSYR